MFSTRVSSYSCSKRSSDEGELSKIKRPSIFTIITIAKEEEADPYSAPAKSGVVDGTQVFLPTKVYLVFIISPLSLGPHTANALEQGHNWGRLSFSAGFC